VQLELAFESPLKSDQAQGGLRFNPEPGQSVMFRGTVEASGLDGDNGAAAGRRSFHLVQRVGQQGPALGTVSLAPGGSRQLRVRLIYPADATPPQVLSLLPVKQSPDLPLMQARKRRVFPFTAIVGQEEMKLALLLNVIDPRIGGVMIMGDRGTGKSTTIRALADLLPEIDVVAGDPYNSSPSDPDLQSSEVRQRAEHGEQLPIEQRQVPMVDLPLGATEDRLCGTIDIEKALSEGVRAFEPGLLAKANRGLLYVDEVNLLDDHLVDVLLDSAASGWNTVEREGVSVRHPARFVLIGSGNPEEGELRPQLLDRFGMSVEVRTVRDPELRVQVVDQRTSFDNDPDGFNNAVQTTQDALQARVVEAQNRLPHVQIDDDLRIRISAICGELDVDGLRGDIVTNRAARALAAFEGRTEVSEDDVARVAACCLRHRLRKDPLEQIDSGDRVVKVFCKVFERPESSDRGAFELALAA
jgi:magnesium chelatase subunit I